MVAAFISFIHFSAMGALLFVVVSHYGFNIIMHLHITPFFSFVLLPSTKTRLLWQTVKVNDLFFKSFTHHLEQFVQHFTMSVYVRINIEDGDYTCVLLYIYVSMSVSHTCVCVCVCVLMSVCCLFISFLSFHSFIWKFPNFMVLLHQSDRTTDSTISLALCA